MKRSELVKQIQEKIDNIAMVTGSKLGDTILSMVEKYMTPKARPLTVKEIDEHPLVKQVHDSRKDEVRNYVAGLDYEWKKTWEPEE